VTLLLPFSTPAQDNGVQADVDVSIQQGQEIWAGQQVTVNLDLKTSGYSFSNTHFNLPEVSGAFLLQTDTTTVKLSERRNGQTWQILRYPLALYPQKSGQVEIPPIDVRFTTSAGFGSENRSFEFQTQPLLVPVNLPPGVGDGELLVTTDAFELDHTWQPESETARAGDAFTLTVSRRAKDISAMLLPPLPVFEATGLAAYPQTPEVNDKSERGQLTGERIDRIIWVLEKPGSYEIPGIRFQWWDPGKRELRQHIVPGLDLEVLSPMIEALATDNTGQGSEHTVQILVLVLSAVLIGAILLRFAGKSAGQPREETERTAFSRLKTACERNQAAEAHCAIHAWLAFLSVPSVTNARTLTLGEFARACGDEQLAADLEQLQEALVLSCDSWQADDLLVSLQRVRRKVSNQKVVRSRAYLGPLNP
jgi:hypothetical protein